MLGEVGFTYSSSVLPARNPLFGDPSLPATPFRWPNGLVELPCPVVRVGGVGLPYLGGVYLRALPEPASSRRPAAASGTGQVLWIYCHPYDFDPGEPFWVVPEAGRLGQPPALVQPPPHVRQASRPRSAAGRAAARPNASTDASHDADRPQRTRGGPGRQGRARASSDCEYSQLEMVHRLPPATLVDRFEYLRERCRGRRVVHVGFVDAGCQELNLQSGAWLHEHLATAAGELIGLDLDQAGVERARARGYEAHAVDCRDVDAVRALGLPPADVVVAGEVIEHLDDPGSFLDGLHELARRRRRARRHHPERHRLGEHRGACSRTSRSTTPTTSCRTRAARSTRMLTRHRWEPFEHEVYIQDVKSSGTDARSRMLATGARMVLGIERLLARLGRPYAAGGLIVAARPVSARLDAG